jgi:hypothetical protein
VVQPSSWPHPERRSEKERDERAIPGRTLVQREIQTDRQRDRQRQAGRQPEAARQPDSQRQTDRQTDKDRNLKKLRLRDRQEHTDRERERESERYARRGPAVTERARGARRSPGFRAGTGSSERIVSAPTIIVLHDRAAIAPRSRSDLAGSGEKCGEEKCDMSK